MSASPAYVYADQADQADRGELARLRLLESSADAHTNELFDRVRVGSGWRCPEVATGAGSIAGELADRVGPTGHVVAVDVDLRFLTSRDLLDRSNLEVRRADVLTDEFEPASFDLVHTRHLLAHLEGRAGEAIERMAAALRPGGWLVVEDTDLSRFLVVTTDPSIQEAADIVLKALRRLIVDRGGDPRIRLQLPGRLEHAGLVDVTVDARLPFVRGDAGLPVLALATFRALGPQLISRGVAQSVLDTVLTAFAEPGFRAFDPARIAVWGRRQGWNA